MMDRIKNSLTRRIGPLPAWAWLTLFAVAVYYYYKRMSVTATASGTGTGSVTPTSPTPGTNEQVLQPGESIYDPTAGTLLTAPGGTGSGGVDPGTAIDDLANAIMAAANTQQTTTQQGDGVTGSGAGIKSSASQTAAAKAKFNKQFNQKFNRTFNQRFNKRWLAARAAKRVTPARTRSTAKVRNAAGGKVRTITRVTPSVVTRTRAVHPVVNIRTRQRPKTPTVRAVVRQRPVASVQPSHRSGATVQFRPSAPTSTAAPRAGTRAKTTAKRKTR